MLSKTFWVLLAVLVLTVSLTDALKLKNRERTMHCTEINFELLLALKFTFLLTDFKIEISHDSTTHFLKIPHLPLLPFPKFFYS